MANFTPTNLSTAQALIVGKFASSELRYTDPVTFKEYLKSSQIMYPSYEELVTREDRAVEAAYTLRSSRSLGSTRAHNHAGTKGDSAFLTPTWATKSDKFSNSLKQGDNNVIKNDRMIASEVENVIANFADGLEDLAVNHAFNNRSQVNVATADGSFNNTNYVYEIVKADKGNQVMQVTKSAMQENKYRGVLTIFCDTTSYNTFQFLSNQGAGNSTNTSFQFGGVTYVHSIGLNTLGSNMGYTKGFWIAAESGTFAAMPWIPIQNRQGISTTVANYGSFINPVDGCTYATHQYMASSDQSASGGQTQDVVTYTEFSIDVAFDNAPLSTANESTLQAFGLV